MRNNSTDFELKTSSCSVKMSQMYFGTLFDTTAALQDCFWVCRLENKGLQWSCHSGWQHQSWVIYIFSDIKYQCSPPRRPELMERITQNMCQLASWCYFWHSNAILFHPASGQTSSFLHLKCLLCLDDYHPVACTPILMYFEKLVIQHIKDSQPGPSPVCFQNQQIHRGCHIYLASLSLHGPGE